MIRNWFWARVAGYLQRNPRLVATLVNTAFRHPYFHLEGYLYRWWLLMPPIKRGRPGYWCLSNQLRRLIPVSVRLHHIVDPDPDPHLHNHPWCFRSLILHGYFVEQLIANGTYQECRHAAGDTYYRDRTEFHRIIDVAPGGVYTLVIHRHRSKGWGFLVHGRCIDWRDYVQVRPPAAGEQS